MHLVAVVGEGDAAALGRRDAAAVTWPTSQGSGARPCAGEDDDALLARTVARRRPAVAPSASHWPWPSRPVVGVAVAAHARLPRAASRTAGRGRRGRASGLPGAARNDSRCSAAATKRRAACVRCEGVSIATARVVSAAGSNSQTLRAALVDDALAVGLGVARVEVVVIGVAADVAAVGKARVEVADALADRRGTRCARRSTSGW